MEASHKRRVSSLEAAVQSDRPSSDHLGGVALWSAPPKETHFPPEEGSQTRMVPRTSGQASRSLPGDQDTLSRAGGRRWSGLRRTARSAPVCGSHTRTAEWLPHDAIHRPSGDHASWLTRRFRCPVNWVLDRMRTGRFEESSSPGPDCDRVQMITASECRVAVPRKRPHGDHLIAVNMSLRSACWTRVISAPERGSQRRTYAVLSPEARIPPSGDHARLSTPKE